MTICTISIIMYHINTIIYSHLYSPIWYLDQKKRLYFFQHICDTFSVCSCCSCRLFSVIQNNSNTAWILQLCEDDDDDSWYRALKCSMPSIDTCLSPLYYSYWIWCDKLATTSYALCRQHKILWKSTEHLNAYQRELPQWWIPRMCRSENYNSSFYVLGM